MGIEKFLASIPSQSEQKSCHLLYTTGVLLFGRRIGWQDSHLMSGRRARDRRGMRFALLRRDIDVGDGLTSHAGGVNMKKYYWRS